MSEPLAKNVARVTRDSIRVRTSGRADDADKAAAGASSLQLYFHADNRRGRWGRWQRWRRFEKIQLQHVRSLGW